MNNNYTSVEKLANEVAWRSVPDQAILFAKNAAPQVTALRRVLDTLPGEGVVYYLPVEKQAFVYTSQERNSLWQDRISTVFNLHVSSGPEQQPDGIGPWMCLEKTALQAKTIFGPAATLAGWKPGPTADLFGGPNTLSASIGTGLLGAGVGYGAGWLGETLAGKENLRKGRLRRTLALVGGAVGAAPAIWAGSRGWFDKPAFVTIPDPLGEGYEQLIAKLPTTSYVRALEKKADGWFNPTSHSDSGAFGAGYWEPTIPKDNLNQLIWSDPLTPSHIRAGASGLIAGASALRGGATWVSPADVARIATGMGAGYVSGRLVGTALGALAGLQPATQERLQQAGTLAGFLSSVIPKAFGN